MLKSKERTIDSIELIETCEEELDISFMGKTIAECAIEAGKYPFTIMKVAYVQVHTKMTPIGTIAVVYYQVSVDKYAAMIEHKQWRLIDSPSWMLIQN